MLTRRTVGQSIPIFLIICISVPLPTAGKERPEPKISGAIESLVPCGSATGAPRKLTFTATMSHGGVDKEKHTATLKLAVFDADANEICVMTFIHISENKEQGIIHQPISCTSRGCLEAGAYFITASLTDQKDSDPAVVLSAQACSVILSP